MTPAQHVPMDAASALAQVAGVIRVIPDFPAPGIQFRDITPLLGQPAAFAACVRLMTDQARHVSPDVIVAVESRGFLFGAPIALALGLPLVPARKAGKLPADTHSIDYGLEYGDDRLEMHVDAIRAGARVLLVDDLLATGGTIAAAAALVAMSGGTVAGTLCLIELAGLGGRIRLNDMGIAVDALLVS